MVTYAFSMKIRIYKLWCYSGFVFDSVICECV